MTEKEPSKLLERLVAVEETNKQLEQGMVNIAMNLGELGNSHAMSSCAIDGLIEVLSAYFKEKPFQKELEEAVLKFVEKKKKEIGDRKIVDEDSEAPSV